MGFRIYVFRIYHFRIYVFRIWHRANAQNAFLFSFNARIIFVFYAKQRAMRNIGASLLVVTVPDPVDLESVVPRFLAGSIFCEVGTKNDEKCLKIQNFSFPAKYLTRDPTFMGGAFSVERVSTIKCLQC